MKHFFITSNIIIVLCNICNLQIELLAGQLFQIAKDLYNTELNITVLESSNNVPGSRNVMVKFRIDFDNRQYVSITYINNLQ